MNTKSKLNKKGIKIITTIILVAVFLMGKIFSPFAISASANGNSTQDVEIQVVDYDTQEFIEDVQITFDKNNNSTPIVATENDPIYDTDLGIRYNYIAYDVNNGNNRTIDVEKSGYSVYNMYKISKNKTDCFVYHGDLNPPYVINPNTQLIKIELKKNSNLDNIAPTLTLTPSTTASTNGNVIITASASDNVAVASITTPDNNTVQFNPAVQNNSTTYTVSINGTYTFKATDTSGNVTTQTIDINNIVANVKPQFTVSIDSYTPTTPSVGSEITFNATIHPQGFEIPIPTKEIVLVLDSSGSMEGTKMEKLKEAAKNFIAKMKDVQNLKIAIVDFDTQATIKNNLIAASNTSTLNASIDALFAEGGTNTGEGLRQAAYLLSNSSEQTSSASKTIVFMSDGEPTYYNTDGQNTSGGWVYGTYTGTYYTYKNGINYGSYSNMPSGKKKGPYTGKYTGYKYIEGQNSYYTDITKSSRDSDVTREGTGYSDQYGYCLTYAQRIGEIIKENGYNAFSIGYGLDMSGTAKIQQIHNSMSTVSSNLFPSDTGSIDSVFNSIADEILDTYPITNVNFNFNPGTDASIESVEGNTINIPDFSYRISSQTSSTVRYTAYPVPFSVKIKSNIAGSNIPIFTNSTVTFPWKNEIITADVPIQYINVRSNAIDNTSPTLTLTQNPQNGTITNGTVTITAAASDNVAVASITTPDNTVQFNPTTQSNSTTYTVSANGTYTFIATDTAGNITTESITVSNIDSTPPVLTLTQNPANDTQTTGTVTITATASDNVAVASITTPNNTVQFNPTTQSNSTTYTVSSNATYTFTATDTVGNIATQTITVSNIIDGQSTILKHGLYNGSGTGITEDSSLNVTSAIPLTMAMIVDVGSSNLEINWSSDKAKIPQAEIVFKKYEILDNGTIGSSETVTLNNNGAINLTGFTMQKGKKYIITYTITPVGSGQVTVTATANGTSTKSVNLNIVAQPDLF